jgi:catechol 2,3-dioxygenase-like lactoylglutathione lyase family enzyme
MRHLRTMLQVRSLETATDFLRNKLGLKEVRRRVDERGSFAIFELRASPRATSQVLGTLRASGAPWASCSKLATCLLRSADKV